MTDFEKGVFNNEVMLILGAPRSGTTLLAAMIGSHEDSAILMEDYYGGVFRVLSKKMPGVKLCIPNQIELNENIHLVRFNKALNILIKLVNPLFDSLFKKRLPYKIIRSCYSIRDYINTASKVHVITILRNPIDATKSEKKRARVTRDYAKQQWLRALDILGVLYNEKESFQSFSLIDFDDLVSDPKNTISKIFKNLELDYSAASMEGFRFTPQYSAREGVSASKASQISIEAVENFFGEESDRMKIYKKLHKACSN